MNEEESAVPERERDLGASGGRPARRRAWRPEADAETAALLRHLAAHPWLVGSRDDALIAAVRRNEHVLRSAVARLGWVLVIERDLVRLRKSPPPRPAAWAAQGPSPAACSWFFLLLAAAESMPPRTAIGHLVTQAHSAAAEAGVPARHDIAERRAIVAALRMLDERGVVERLDGDLDGYLHDDHAPVLLAIHHTRLAYVVANPGAVDPAADPQAWLEQVQREPDAARRMRRALVDDTCVHVALLDEAEAQWLSQRVRGDDGGPLADAFGLVLERRAEGAAFVVPDEAYRHLHELGPMPFPAPGTVNHAALLLLDHAALHGTTGDGPGPGWRGMTEDQVVAALTGFADGNASGRGGWGAEYAHNPVLLASKVRDLLVGAHLARLNYGGSRAGEEGAAAWWFAPTAGRWAQGGNQDPKGGRSRSSRSATAERHPHIAVQQGLFGDTKVGDMTEESTR
ncbi:TIGR02678 family protein [Streptomyces sp. NBC_00162]|uniref:TIGR02678 family protein n=1 Tax=Streptomyces sp. NBC_00162 TaxID=2903629 RepID=UPI00214B8F63|nr:TIGR02678 family protein [Streptomyces sp. NBC_00162]UUU45127.1 TIGR02678 family protein [Streptomyces sp. NBC_00162]